MKVTYSQQTDTLYIEFKASAITQSRDLDENTILDIDEDGNICALTIEHAKDRIDIPHFSFEQVAAWLVDANHGQSAACAARATICGRYASTATTSA